MKPPRVLLLLALALLPLLPSVAGAEIREDEEQNYLLETPDGWSWDPSTREWEKYGIVVGAIRRLEELKDGSPADGQGAMVHLAITDAPEGESIDRIARDEEVRGFLMSRFDPNPSRWPDVETVSDTLEELELRILRTEGEARNLKGDKAPAVGVMLLTVAKGRLYKLRMYAWPSKFDDEGLKDDLDLIEIQFTILDTSPAEATEPEAARPPPEDGGAEEPPQGDAGEEKVFENRLQGWRLVKPVKIASDEVDTATYPNMEAIFQGRDASGLYQFTLAVHQRGRIVNGVQQQDLDIRDWITEQWWKYFHEQHPEGEILTYDFPRNRSTETFLVLPDFEDEDVVASRPERRPEDPSASDMMRRMKVVEKVKGRLGEEKVSVAYRGVMAGNRERVGREIELRYAWTTPGWIFLLTGRISPGVLEKYEEPLNQLLQSFEILDD